MKKDDRSIDEILDSMFHSGRLNLGGSRQTQKQVDEALKSLQEAQLNTAVSLNSDIEQLTRDVQAEMKDLEIRLEEDGIKSSDVPAGNIGPEKNIDDAFSKTETELKEQILGQDVFISDLTVALKRPFVIGYDESMPMERAAVLGKAGTGKRSALHIAMSSLGRQGVIKSPKISWIDLGSYSEPADEKLFYQDMFAALKSGSAALVFENYGKCCNAVLTHVAQLFKEGRVDLPGRYVEQKGSLVDIGTALVPGAVSFLSVCGKYVFLLSEKGEDDIIGVFGAPFLDSMDDVCATSKLSDESLLKIASKDLEEFRKKAASKLSFALALSDNAAKCLAAHGSSPLGVEGMDVCLDRLYKELGEYKLRNSGSSLEGTVTEKEGTLCVKVITGGSELYVGAEKDVPDAVNKAKEAVKAELDEIVGLGSVKEYILSLEDNFTIQQLRHEKGLKADSPSMHMIFTGNPGTGKTTMARIVSEYLKAIGVLSGGQLVEVTRADLVGQYVGHTAPLTQKAITSALGGVLFIDEAYSLYRGKDDSFGLECIDTLVKGMEDNRKDLVVILAGYSKEMKEFLTSNSGLRSRFPNIIEFPDYTAQELLDITKSIVNGKGYKLSPECDEPLLEFYDKAQKSGDPSSNGNGRMARNKVEEAVIACSRRNIRMPEEERDLELLLPEDFGL